MADRCPLKQQNYDYILYVLTALYHEAWKKETWEQEKSEADMEFYDWARSVSRQNILSYLSLSSNDTTNDTSPHLPDYEQAVSELFNQGEDDYTLFKYKESTKKLFEIHEDQTL
uniref:Uncharacterized protein n=1 Tax=Timema cristinae TaxID=61476 RepID=A0A7R9H7N3_TIMCR|nr:unnamed protein product [Timema cristinae]